MKKTIKKIISSICCISILTIVVLSSISNAASYIQEIRSGINNFPVSYQDALKKLHEEYPNWTFDAYYTGIDWKTAIQNEYGPHNDPKCRVPNSSAASWKDSCGFVKSGFTCASESIIRYYIDPRNFLTAVNIFQFSEMSFNPKVHTLATVQSIVKGTFLEVYAQDIYDAAKESQISPFSIRAKIIQEVGVNGSASVSGTYPGYEGLYNFYNYGAADTGNPIVNALETARQKEWTTPRKAIIEGAKLMGSSYVNAGQNTAYFYKFDVVGRKILQTGQTQTVTSDMIFSHQYMTNVVDPYSQSISLYNMYVKNKILDSNVNFIIPIYNNMPGGSEKPTNLTGDIYYVEVQDALILRDKPSKTGAKVGSLSRGDKVQMLERNCVKADGYSWDKIKTESGKICYAAGQYLKKYGGELTGKFNKNDIDRLVNALPMATVSDIKQEYGMDVTTIKNKDGQYLSDTDTIGTDAKITIKGVVYTILKLGDSNGDGNTSTRDAQYIQESVLGQKTISENAKYACDLNKDGKITTRDAQYIQEYVLGQREIKF